LDSQASSSDEEDDERTVSMVATDTDASPIFDLPHDDPELDSLRLNSAVASRVPEEVIAIDELEEGEWTDEETAQRQSLQEYPRAEDLRSGDWIDPNRNTDLTLKDSPVVGYQVIEVYKGLSVYTPLAPPRSYTEEHYHVEPVPKI